MKAVIYLRISTNNQSLEMQHKICELQANQLGIKKKIVFKDIISGTTEIFKRPGLVDAFLNLQKGDVFIVASRDRLARNLIIVSNIEVMIKKCKAKLIIVDQENKKKLTKFEKYNLDMIAQKKVLSIRNNTKKAIKEKMYTNQIIGNIKKISNLVDNNIYLKNDLEEEKRIKKIKKLKREGFTMSQIAEVMNQDDLCNRNKKLYTTSQIKKIIIPAKKLSNNSSYGVTLNEQQMIKNIHEFHEKGISLRNILKLINQLGYRTRKDTPLQLTQIVRIIKKKQL